MRKILVISNLIFSGSGELSSPQIMCGPALEGVIPASKFVVPFSSLELSPLIVIDRSMLHAFAFRFLNVRDRSVK